MHHFTFHLWFFPLLINFEYCMILCSCVVFSSCRQDNQFCGAILAIINDSKMEGTIIFLNFHSGLGFVLKEVEDMWEKGESVKWTCAKRSCRKGEKMSKVFFLGKAFSWQKLCVIVMKSNNITAEVMLALHMNKSCKVESCYPIQKCFGRFRDTWWNYAQICFHLWQLTETLRQQPKKEVKCHRSPHRISIISIHILLIVKKAVTLYEQENGHSRQDKGTVVTVWWTR